MLRGPVNKQPTTQRGWTQPLSSAWTSTPVQCLRMILRDPIQGQFKVQSKVQSKVKSRLNSRFKVNSRPLQGQFNIQGQFKVQLKVQGEFQVQFKVQGRAPFARVRARGRRILSTGSSRTTPRPAQSQASVSEGSGWLLSSLFQQQRSTGDSPTCWLCPPMWSWRWLVYRLCCSNYGHCRLPFFM